MLLNSAFRNTILNWAWWYMPVISALGRRQTVKSLGNPVSYHRKQMSKSNISTGSNYRTNDFRLFIFDVLRQGLTA